MPKVKPGEVHDKKGVPVYPGDLIRSFHFRARRRRQVFFLYHVAVWNREKEVMEMVPASHLEQSRVDSGGRCWLSQGLMADAEVIDGVGPGDCLSHTDRPKVKAELTTSEG